MRTHLARRIIQAFLEGVFMKRFVVGFPAVLALGFAFAAGAHTAVTKTRPAADTPLESSPPTIEIEFKHAMQMTSVVVLDAGKSERKLTFTPATSATLITIKDRSAGRPQ
jgi:methionine-rich copper-binding protein CopC